MATLQIFSIFIEAIIAMLAALLWVRRKNINGGLIFVTFTIYVFYDVARLWAMEVPEPVLRISFAVASISMLVAVWRMYNQK